MYFSWLAFHIILKMWANNKNLEKMIRFFLLELSLTRDFCQIGSSRLGALDSITVGFKPWSF